MVSVRRSARRSRTSSEDGDEEAGKRAKSGAEAAPSCTCGSIDGTTNFDVRAAWLNARYGRSTIECRGCKTGMLSDSTGEVVYMCLACGYLGCAGFGEEPAGHAEFHSLRFQHPVAFRFDSPISCWCFSCELSPKVGTDHVLYELQKWAERESVSSEDDESFDNYFVEDEEVGEFVKDIPVPGDKKVEESNCFIGKEIVIRGLENVDGTTCYMNSVLQNLLVIGDLRKYFTRLDEQPRIIGSMTSALKELFEATEVMNNDSPSTFWPADLLGCVRSKYPHFQGSDHQDSHELLKCLLGVLKEEEIDDGSALDQTMVDSVFGGLLSDNVTCLKCHRTNKVAALFHDLSLSIPTKTQNHENSRASQPQRPLVWGKRNDGSTGEDVGVSSSNQSSCLKSGSDLGERPASLVKDPTKPLEFVLSDPQCVVSSVNDGREEKQPSDGREAIESPRISPELQASGTENFSHDREYHEVVTKEELLNAKAAEHLRSLTLEHEKKAGAFEDPRGISGLDVLRETYGSAEEDESSVEVEEGTSLYSCLNLYARLEFLSERHCEDCLKNFYEESAENSNDSVSILPLSANTQPDKCGAIANLDGAVDADTIGESTEACVKVPQRQLGQVEESGYDATCDLDQVEVENDSYSIKPLQAIPAQRADNYYESSTLDTSNLSEEKENARLVSDENLKDSTVDKQIMYVATKQLLIKAAPRVLTLHLKRFHHETGSPPRKIHDHVSFPEFLDLAPYFDESSIDKKPCMYHLTGVVQHKGNTVKRGHYIAHVRGEQINKGTAPAIFSWFSIDDTLVKESSLSDVLDSEAYILFYVKCGPSDLGSDQDVDLDKNQKS